MTPWNGEVYAITRDINIESGEKTAGQEFFLVQRIQLAAFAKQTGGSKQKRRG